MDRLTALLNASAFVRRMTAISIAMVFCLIAAGIVVAMIGSLRSEARDLAEKRAELGRLYSVVGLRETLQKEIAASNRNSSNSEFLSGSSEAVIRGNLQSRFTSIAASHGVNVMSVGNAPALKQGAIRFAGLRADFSGTNEQVLSTLFEIETSKPFLVIRNARIRSVASFQANGKQINPKVMVQALFYGALPPNVPENSAQGAGGNTQ